MKNWLIKELGGFTFAEFNAQRGFKKSGDVDPTTESGRDRIKEINQFLVDRNNDLLNRLNRVEADNQFFQEKNLGLIQELAEYRKQTELYDALRVIITHTK